ncbi:unnamed protein product [Trichobilharzia szidati]|nr:unnamed protein product [Trichobilharzia szidati]
MYLFVFTASARFTFRYVCSFVNTFLENVAMPTAQGPFYPIRNMDHRYICGLQPFFCPMPFEVQQHEHMSMAAHTDYGHFQHQLNFSPLVPQVANIPNQSNAIHTSSDSMSIPVRERRPLDVIDPQTKSAVNLEEASKSPSEPRKRLPLLPQLILDESPPIMEKETEKSCADFKDEGISSTETVSHEDCETKDIVSEITRVEVSECNKSKEEHSSQEDVVDWDDAEEDKEVKEEEEEEEEEEEVMGRNRYPRDFILGRKDSASLITLEGIQAIMNQFANAMKMSRTRSNHGPRNKVIKLLKTITVKRVEGAFVPSKLRSQDANGVTDAKNIAQELNIILNRVSDNNIQETINDIKMLKISTPDDLNLLAKTIFQKGIRQSKYSKVFANLCKQLKGFEVQGSERFSVLILQLTQELFHKRLEVLINELNTTIDAKIASAKDDSVKRMFEEDRETSILKKTESYYGNITFIAELYLTGFLPIKTITECLKKLRDSSEPEALPSLIIFLNLCGKDLEQNCKTILDSCFKRLEQYKDSKKIETHQMYKVQELVELRSRGWKPMDTTQLQPQIDTSRRNVDDKGRRNFIPPDPKRKSVQSVNPLTPSSLAVTPQSYDSRKLGPTVANWTQGSGLLRPSEDSHTKQSQQNSLLHRSRESSPRMPPGPQGAWANPLPVIQKPKQKDYDSMLEDTKRIARTVVETVSRSESECHDCVVECKPNERPALLHNMFDLLMDRTSKERHATGHLCVDLLRKKVLKESDIITACENFFKFCDSDWAADYPQGWLYIAEILHHLISGESDYMAVLLELVEPIRSDDRASKLMAHCISLSKKNTTIDKLVLKLRNCNFMWAKLGVPSDKTWNFVYERSIEFTMAGVYDFECKKLRELTDLVSNPSVSSEKVRMYFNELSQSNLSKWFMQSIMPVLLKSSDQSKTGIDATVMSLHILIDHKPDKEFHVLSGFQDSSINKALIAPWLSSLVEKKVISADALSQWKKSDSDGLVAEILSGNPELRNL